MNQLAPRPEKVTDLRPIKGDALTWDAKDPVGSLERVAQAVGNEAECAINWYLEKKRTKKLGALWLRVCAIVLTTVAALVPILVEIFEQSISGNNGGGRPWWASAAWSSAFLIIAFALVLLDRFYGFSSAWMRFLSAECQIRETLHAFRMDWALVRAGWKDGPPNEQQIRDGLQTCRVFLGQVDGILKSELDTWVQEFRASLKDIDESVKARPDTLKTAAANITIENGEQCLDGWKLIVDRGPPLQSHGRTAALANLLPGMRHIEVIGQINGKAASAAKAFIAASGSVSDVSLKLE